MIADMFSNKKNFLIVNELFIRGKKLNIFGVFITQSYFALPKNVRLNFMHYFIMKILSKWELQQIAFNHSSHIHCMKGVCIRSYCSGPYFSTFGTEQLQIRTLFTQWLNLKTL